MDYVLRVKVKPNTQPVAKARIEARKDTLPPGHGLDQGEGYAECKRLNVPFVFSSNGHQLVMFERFSGRTGAPRPMNEFPSPAEPRASYEEDMGFSLEAPVAKLLGDRPRKPGESWSLDEAAMRRLLHPGGELSFTAPEADFDGEHEDSE